MTDNGRKPQGRVCSSEDQLPSSAQHSLAGPGTREGFGDEVWRQEVDLLSWGMGGRGEMLCCGAPLCSPPCNGARADPVL